MNQPNQQAPKLQQFSFGLKLNENVIISAIVIAANLEDAHAILEQDVLRSHDFTNTKFMAQVQTTETREFGRRSGLILPENKNGKIVDFTATPN